MRTDRFRTGLVILTGLAMAILSVIPGRRPASSGLVDGTVIFHGRPLAGGLISFTPEDPDDSAGMSARIDEDGHFECDPQWRRDRAARMRFRIDVLLAPHNLSPDPPPDEPGESPEAGDGADPDPIGDGERGPIGRIVRASWRSQGRPSPRRAAESGRRRSTFDLCILQREVWLGPEPAHLDIDVRD